MITVRDAIEQTILVSLGAASVTRERVEAIVAELVRKGQLGGEDGKALVDRLMSRVRGEGAPAQGLVGRLEGGLHGALREVGVVTKPQVDDIELRLAALEHRVSLLEGPTPEAPAS